MKVQHNNKTYSLDVDKAIDEGLLVEDKDYTEKLSKVVGREVKIKK